MRKIILILPAILALGACDKQPTQEINMLCGDFKVNAKIYDNRADLKLLRITKTYDYWLDKDVRQYEWINKQMPMIDDAIEISLPKLPDAFNENNAIPRTMGNIIFDNGNKQLQFALSYDRLTDSADALLASYCDGFIATEESVPAEEVNGNIINWTHCTPLFNYNYPVSDSKNKANITPEKAKEIKNCIAGIEKFGFCNDYIDGQYMYILNCKNNEPNRMAIPAQHLLDVINKSEEDYIAANVNSNPGTRIFIIHAYNNADGVIKTYETDACEVLQRINDYINKSTSEQ